MLTEHRQSSLQERIVKARLRYIIQAARRLLDDAPSSTPRPSLQQVQYLKLPHLLHGLLLEGLPD